MADPLFSVSGLTVSFGGVRAVDDVNFDLDRGSILGIIGPNGAGKTTVFDAICGFVQAKGRITLDGRDISGKSPERRSRARLGRSFQDARLFPSLTVGEALAVGLERHIRTEGVVSTALRLPWVRRSERKVKNKVDELIELMGLGAFRDKFVAELSTGSRRIVDLALTMAHEPLVLLLDEPSSGIAQRETEALGPLLLRIREETGASLLVIEHDMPLITSISDEILALETGQVLLRGKPDEVLHDPRLIAAYLGNDPAAIRRSGARDAGAAPGTATAAEPASTPATSRATARRPAAKKAPAATRTTPARKPAATATTAAKKAAPAKKRATTSKASASKATTSKAATSKATAAKDPATEEVLATDQAVTARLTAAAKKVAPTTRKASTAKKAAAAKKASPARRAPAKRGAAPAAEVIDLTERSDTATPDTATPDTATPDTATTASVAAPSED